MRSIKEQAEEMLEKFNSTNDCFSPYYNVDMVMEMVEKLLDQNKVMMEALKSAQEICGKVYECGIKHPGNNVAAMVEPLYKAFSDISHAINKVKEGK